MSRMDGAGNRLNALAYFVIIDAQEGILSHIFYVEENNYVWFFLWLVFEMSV